MRVLLICNGELSDAMIATSLVKRLENDGCKVHCVSTTPELFRFSASLSDSLYLPLEHYDEAINLSPAKACTDVIDKVHAKRKFGYCGKDGMLKFLNDGADLHYRSRVIGVPTLANVFQLTFGLAGRSWQGEGYGINYFPRNRMKRNTVGIAMRDREMSDFVSSNLKIGQSRLWRIPIKSNPLRLLDEVARCPEVITDDESVVHAALALRRKVEYLVPRTLPFRLEMFGSGHVHTFTKRRNVY